MTDLRNLRSLRRPLTGAVLAAITTLPALAALPALAQDDSAGLAGPRLDFTLGFNLSRNDNPDLFPAAFADPETTASLSLGFALITETALSRLGFSGGGALRFSNDGGTSGALVNPSLGLAWDYGVENTSLSFSVLHSDTDLATQSATAADFGPGHRLTDSIMTELALGKVAPFGATLRAEAEQTDYRNADPSLTDRKSARLGLDLRADVFEVWQLTLGLGASAFQTVGGVRRDSYDATAGVTYLRARSTTGLSFGLTDTPEGRRQSLSLDHQLDLPSGSLSFGIAGARGVTGADNLTGSFGWTQDYARGTLALDLSRALVASTTSDAETLESLASLQWTQEVTRTGSLLLGLSYADEAPTSGAAATTTAQIAGTWTEEIGQDWVMVFGLTHARRDTGSFDGQSNLISLGLSRDFSLRF